MSESPCRVHMFEGSFSLVTAHLIIQRVKDAWHLATHEAALCHSDRFRLFLFIADPFYVKLLYRTVNGVHVISANLR